MMTWDESAGEHTGRDQAEGAAASEMRCGQLVREKQRRKKKTHYAAINHDTSFISCMAKTFYLAQFEFTGFSCQFLFNVILSFYFWLWNLGSVIWWISGSGLHSSSCVWKISQFTFNAKSKFLVLFIVTHSHSRRCSHSRPFTLCSLPSYKCIPLLLLPGTCESVGKENRSVTFTFFIHLSPCLYFDKYLTLSENVVMCLNV